MRTPSYWNKKNLISYFLLPFGVVYAFATSRRVSKPSKQADKKVICVGNLTAGGSGKTPVAISIVGLLRELGYNPAFVSRGYGGKIKGVMVDPKIHTAHDVGDEPMVLARIAPVSINPDRYKAAEKAIAEGADIIVMDDGYQNPTLKKDISFLVFDGDFGIGNGFPIPAGPMRENFEEGLERASAAMIIGDDTHHLSSKLRPLPVFYGRVEPVKPKEIKNKKIIAFAGIGRPEKFYHSLREAGFDVLETKDFPDHYCYTKKELNDLLFKARKLGADIYTTSKDYVKIPTDLQPNFKILEIKINWGYDKKLRDFIEAML